MCSVLRLVKMLFSKGVDVNGAAFKNSHFHDVEMEFSRQVSINRTVRA